MKNLILVVLSLLIGLFFSCGTVPTSGTIPTSANPYKPLSEIPNATVIDIVQISRYSVPGSGRLSGRVPWVNDAVYLELLSVAKKKYPDRSIDIADIYWVASDRDNRNPVDASGKIVSIGGDASRLSTATGVEGALERASVEVTENFTARSRIAIVYITAEDRSSTVFITGELEHLLRRQGFVIIDRSELDRIRTEQRFGLSGEVDDATAARIGNFAGANIVITGRIDGEGNLRRLRLRALDTTNAQVVGTASERL